MESCPEHGHTCERIKAVETRVEAHDIIIGKIEDKLEEIFKLLQSRPSWTVCLVISGLTGACSVLLTVVTILIKYQ